jgi:hypothetical protein
MCSHDKEKTPSLFYVYLPRYAKCSALIQCPKPFFCRRHNPDTKVGRTRKVNPMDKKEVVSSLLGQT